MIAHFGNVAPLHEAPPSDTGEHLTVVSFADGSTVDEAFVSVTDPSGLWAAHSATRPSWVACSDPDLESRLSAHYDCPAQTVPGVNS